MSIPYLVDNRAYGLGSMGDEVVLSGVLERFGRENCVVVSYDVAETEALHHVRAVPSKRNVDYETLLVGGGGILFIGHAELIARLINRAKDAGKRVIVHSVAIINDKHDNVTVRAALARADEFTVRDVCSMRWAYERYGLHPDFMADPSVDVKAVPRVWARDILRELGIDFNAPIIGVNATTTPTGVEFIAEALTTLPSDCQFIGIWTCAHKESPKVSGFPALERLAQLSNREIKIPRGEWRGMLAPGELKGVIRECHLMVSMRKHPAFLAYYVDTPTILVDAPNDQDVPHRLWPLHETLGLPIVDIFDHEPNDLTRVIRRKLA